MFNKPYQRSPNATQALRQSCCGVPATWRVRETGIIKPGYTLVEFILAGGILTILLLLVTRMFVATVELRIESEAEGSVVRDARYVMSRLTYDLARAESVVSPANPGESGSSLQLVVGGENYLYSWDGSKLELATPATSGQLHSAGSEVTAVSFTRLSEVDGPTSVRVELTLSSVTQTARGAESRELVTTVRVRE